MRQGGAGQGGGTGREGAGRDVGGLDWAGLAFGLGCCGLAERLQWALWQSPHRHRSSLVVTDHHRPKPLVCRMDGTRWRANAMHRIARLGIEHFGLDAAQGSLAVPPFSQYGAH